MNQDFKNSNPQGGIPMQKRKSSARQCTSCKPANCHAKISSRRTVVPCKRIQLTMVGCNTTKVNSGNNSKNTKKRLAILIHIA